jgi:hypothetical protein
MSMYREDKWLAEESAVGGIQDANVLLAKEKTLLK